MLKIFIDPGTLSPEKIVDLINESKNQIKIVTQNEDRVASYKKIMPSCDVVEYPMSKIRLESGLLKYSPYKIWSKIIDDHQTFMLYDRSNKFPVYAGYKVNRILKKVISCQLYLEQEKPDMVVYMSTPHHLDTWVFARVAEVLGIPVLFFHHSIFPWRFYLKKNLTRYPEIISPSQKKDLDDEYRLVDDFVARKKSNAVNALPIYEKKRLIETKGKYFSWKNEFFKWHKRPDLILNKFLCYKRYCELTKNFVPPKKYIVFFLHYQPERTTLPEGYGFSEQMMAIYEMVSSLPQGIKLLVKEHPTTFTYNCSWKVRYPSYYDELIEVGNVELVPIDIDAYSLIDSAMIVSTITGTVAGEALIRGVPAIVFGNSPIMCSNSQMCYVYSGLDTLRDFILLHCLSSDKNFSFKDDVVHELIDSTYSGIMDFKSVKCDLCDLSQYRENAILKGFKELLSSSCSP